MSKSDQQRVQHLTDENFDKEVLCSEIPVLVDFFATWCGPCKSLSPIIEQIAQEHGTELKVGKVDVGEQRELAAKFKIFSVPTVMLFKHGEVAASAKGYRSKDQLEAMLE